MGRLRKINWTPEQVALLGTMPDMRLAETLGISQPIVSSKRRASGIPKFHSWTAAKLKLLGTMPDRQLAKLLGLQQVTIATKRRALRIPAFQAIPTEVKSPRWTAPQIAVLHSHDDDLAVARLLNRTTRDVAAQRKRLATAKRNGKAK